ncbi:hypothetical protein C475_10889 [Halosimplex carlsbadense 2-9-1]|uniref:Uncharacterized protein n=1 Tax=Halosimplex carlsbadense 2-9-1 TaxID=797114 RepID=M0CRP0_9EURY|nr:hypothetical protein C475_10889 [Halosimplex carlsbadense 2-9-1]
MSSSSSAASASLRVSRSHSGSPSSSLICSDHVRHVQLVERRQRFLARFEEPLRFAEFLADLLYLCLCEVRV